MTSTPASPASSSQRVPLYVQLLSQTLQQALRGERGGPQRLSRQLLTRDEVQSACIDMVVHAMKLGAAGGPSEGEGAGPSVPGSPGVQARARERARLQTEVLLGVVGWGVAGCCMGTQCMRFVHTILTSMCTLVHTGQHSTG